MGMGYGRRKKHIFRGTLPGFRFTQVDGVKGVLCIATRDISGSTGHIYMHVACSLFL